MQIFTALRLANYPGRDQDLNSMWRHITPYRRHTLYIVCYCGTTHGPPIGSLNSANICMSMTVRKIYENIGATYMQPLDWSCHVSGGMGSGSAQCYYPDPKFEIRVRNNICLLNLVQRFGHLNFVLNFFTKFPVLKRLRENLFCLEICTRNRPKLFLFQGIFD